MRSLACALMFAALPALAQTPAPQPPLLPPAGLVYRYWPMQLVQFVGQELPYSMIVLDVDDRPQPDKTPSYDVALTERATGRQVHYVNKPALVEENRARHQDAYLVRMQLDGPPAPGKDAQYLLRFNTEKGEPVQWQFVELTDLSDQGSGLSPIDAPVPVLLYREQGALAGEGTALKIGSVTSTADVWSEYAHPPQFVPYHGALALGVHVLTFAPVNSAWTDAQPPALSAGASWKLTSALGTALTAQADAGKGASTVLFVNEAYGTNMAVEAQPAPNGWAVSCVRFGPLNAKPEHTVSLVFTPATAPGTSSRFDVIAGKKSKIASGSVETKAGDNGATAQTWTMASPDWAKGKSAAATASIAH